MQQMEPCMSLAIAMNRDKLRDACIMALEQPATFLEMAGEYASRDSHSRAGLVEIHDRSIIQMGFAAIPWVAVALSDGGSILKYQSW
jgi:hypothetical protein